MIRLSYRERLETMNKQAMVNALRCFINQRSGIEFCNYQTGDWKASQEAFLSDYRPMLKHGRHARTMLRAVELRDSITAENLLNASRAYSGRLQFVERGDKVGMDYTTGQYFVTEYRKAACAVLAQCLWDFWAKDVKTAQEIRQQARAEFGRAIAQTWFH